MADEHVTSDTSRADQAGVRVDALQRLWAPWRYGYVADHDPIEGCPFCVLPARPTADDRSTLILHRGRHTFVILNAYPYNPGHVMVVPHAHVDRLDLLDDEASDELWASTRHVARVLRERLGCNGVNLGMNLGAAAGAGIADHLHQHVVPRWQGDTNFVSVVGSSRVLPQALDETWQVLAGGFDAL